MTPGLLSGEAFFVPQRRGASGTPAALPNGMLVDIAIWSIALTLNVLFAVWLLSRAPRHGTFVDAAERLAVRARSSRAEIMQSGVRRIRAHAAGGRRTG
jgi:hypothetical protein